MDQNGSSEGIEMKQNVPTRAQLTKINQNNKKYFKMNQNRAK